MHNFPLVNISTDTNYVVVHMTSPILMWNHCVNVNALQIRYMYMYNNIILFPLCWTIWGREAACCTLYRFLWDCIFIFHSLCKSNLSSVLLMYLKDIDPKYYH